MQWSLWHELKLFLSIDWIRVSWKLTHDSLGCMREKRLQIEKSYMFTQLQTSPIVNCEQQSTRETRVNSVNIRWPPTAPFSSSNCCSSLLLRIWSLYASVLIFFPSIFIFIKVYPLFFCYCRCSRSRWSQQQTRNGKIKARDLRE